MKRRGAEAVALGVLTLFLWVLPALVSEGQDGPPVRGDLHVDKVVDPRALAEADALVLQLAQPVPATQQLAAR